MKIELSKKIKLEQLEFIGEVDFFEKSPYIELLNNIKTRDGLECILKEKGMPKSARNNIIKNLESLKVLKDNNIVDVKNGFPEKEYGKYILKVYVNDTKMPFEFKNKSITREKAVSNFSQDELKPLLPELTKFLANKNELILEKKEVDVNIQIQQSKAIQKNIGNGELEITCKGNTSNTKENRWTYTVNQSKSYLTKEISFDELFEYEWDETYKSLNIEFSKIQNNDKCIEKFTYSYNKDIDIDNYGDLKANFTDIPVVPREEKDAKQWFICLLKYKIETKDSYLSKEELQALWGEVREKYPKLTKFNLEFSLKEILKQFEKTSKCYWLIKASIDLYPFDNRLAPKGSVIVEEKENANFNEDFFNKFQLDTPKELTIIDRWVVNLAQFQGLEKVIQNLKIPQVIIITQKIKDKRNTEKVNKIIQNNNIKIIYKEKNEIAHQRYWIFDKEHIYQTSESLDFICIKDEIIHLKYTTFDKREKNELDSRVSDTKVAQ